MFLPYAPNHVPSLEAKFLVMVVIHAWRKLFQLTKLKREKVVSSLMQNQISFCSYLKFWQVVMNNPFLFFFFFGHMSISRFIIWFALTILPGFILVFSGRGFLKLSKAIAKRSSHNLSNLFR